MASLNLFDPNLAIQNPTLYLWIQQLKNPPFKLTNEQIQVHYQSEIAKLINNRCGKMILVPLKKHTQTPNNQQIAIQNIQKSLQDMQHKYEQCQLQIQALSKEGQTVQDKYQKLQIEYKQQLQLLDDNKTEMNKYKEKINEIELENKELKIKANFYVNKWQEVNQIKSKQQKDLIKLNECLDELHDKYDVRQHENDKKYEQKIDGYLKIIDELRKRLCLMNGTSKQYHTLNLKQINKLSLDLHSGLKATEDARAQYLDNTLNCVVCKDNKKNILFSDGCEHIAVCGKCERKMNVKKCPICQRKYKKIRQIKL